MANKLTSLGVGSSVLSRGENSSLIPVQRDSKLFYVDAAKEHCGRTRNAVRLQLRDDETDSLERLKAHFLVGRWQEGDFFVD